MALDPRLAEIFEAWFDYDYAADEDSKTAAGTKRNQLIEAVLKAKKSAAVPIEFLRAFRDDYRTWMLDSELKHGIHKRF